MSEIVQHIVNYTLNELKIIVKEGEVFRKYPKNPKRALEEIRPYLEGITANIEVGNQGKIKINGDVITPFEKKKDYYYVTLQGKIDYLIYRLVAETWCEFPGEDTNGWHVHHIIDDGLNNRPENLIWVTKNNHLYIHNNISESMEDSNV
jgi:hypothetical protein